MQMPIKLMRQSFIDEYDFWHNAKDWFVYMEIRKDGYWLLQAGIFANRLPWKQPNMGIKNFIWTRPMEA